MDSLIKILLVEDNLVVRKMLKMMLEGEEGFQVTADANNGMSALMVLQSGVAVDVVVSDLNMPTMDGIELTVEITKTFPHIKVIILTMHAKVAFLQRAMDAGAKGFLLKDGEMEDIFDAIRRVYAGEVVFGAVGR